MNWFEMPMFSGVCYYQARDASRMGPGPKTIFGAIVLGESFEPGRFSEGTDRFLEASVFFAHVDHVEEI
jgi:hypothetical protein